MNQLKITTRVLSDTFLAVSSIISATILLLSLAILYPLIYASELVWLLAIVATFISCFILSISLGILGLRVANKHRRTVLSQILFIQVSGSWLFTALVSIACVLMLITDNVAALLSDDGDGRRGLFMAVVLYVIMLTIFNTAISIINIVYKYTKYRTISWF